MAKLKDNIVLVMLYLSTVYTLYSYFFERTVLDYSHYAHFILLLIATIVQFFKYPIGKLLLGVVLLVGTLGNAAMTPTIYFLKLGIITISLPYLLCLIIYLLFYRNKLGSWLLSALADKK